MIWVLIIVAVALLAVVGLLVYRQRRSAQLRGGFGPEDDRVVSESGDQRAAEAELRERRERRRSYDIKPLPSLPFLKAGEIWNASKTPGGNDAVDLPLPAVKVTTVPVKSCRRPRGST